MTDKKKTTTVETVETAETVVEVEFKDMPGAHLLKPVKRFMPREVVRLQGAVEKLRETGHTNLEAIADFLEYIDTHCVVDSDAWVEFCTNKATTGEVLDLATAYVNEMGKEKLS